MRASLYCMLISALPCCTSLRRGSDLAERLDAGGQSEAATQGEFDATAEGVSDAAAQVQPLPTQCTLRHPPGPPDAASSPVPSQPPANDLVFAIATTESGTTPNEAGALDYTNLGFDLDNTCTGFGSCVEPPWASVSHHVGVDGIDNAYGQYIQAGIANIVDASPYAPELLLRITNYSGASDQDPVDVALYGALGVTPRGDGGTDLLWDGMDRWRILPEFLVDPGGGALPSVDQPRYRADRAYVASGVLVARFDKTLWPSPLSDQPGATPSFGPRMPLTLRGVVMAGKLAQVGNAGGAWELQDLVEGSRVSMSDALFVLAMTSIQQPDADPNQLYCEDKPSYDVGKRFLCQYTDITADPNAPPSSTCDGLSIGVKFQAKQAMLGDVAGPAPARPPCSPEVPLGTDTCDTLGDQ